MRRSLGISVVAVALLVVAASLALWGCGTAPAISGPRETTAISPQAAGSDGHGTASAISQIEALFGLPKGAVSQSTQPAPMSPSDVTLTWGDGHAEVDVNSGHVRWIIVDSDARHSETHLSDSALDQSATHIMELLGWDSKSLVAQGFTAGETKNVDRGDGPTEYTKTWAGHDDQGVPNQGLLEVALDAASGKLLHFFYNPGPQAGATSPATISKDDAIRIALDKVGDDPPANPTTTDTLPGGATTTGPSLGIVVTSAEVVHSDAPAVTGGKDMLVWIVKLGGYTRSGVPNVTVYIDAATGKVLAETY